MTAKEFIAEHWFHSVGQGLFSSGMLAGSEEWPRPGYRWVYDCGTCSLKHHLNASLSSLEKQYGRVVGGKPVLDLVVVSHFDRDHISGLVSLLSKFHVRDLLLPYLPLWQRLTIAASEAASTRSALSRFLINPAAFVARLPGARVERILFAPSGDQAASPRDGAPDDPTPLLPERVFDQTNEEIDSWRTETQTTETPEVGGDADEDACLDVARDAARSRGTVVEYLSPGTAIDVEGLWEFVPYNDSELAPLATDSFRRTVSRLRGDLLQGKSTLTRDEALNKIKAKYDSTFKKTSERRNMVSLFLYSGPTVRGSTCATLHSTHTGKWLQHTCASSSPRTPARGGFGAVLYTGDGFVDTAQRFDSLSSYMGRTRINRVDVLQVMHHGSKNNWHEKLASKFDPMFSVFCSDPLHRKFGHPHQEVLRDFWTYGPLQVDTQSAAQFSCLVSL